MKLFFIIFIISIPSIALDFDTQKVSYQAKINEISYTANFSFTNKSKSDVTIERLTPSCNCIIPDVVKKTYKPGEKGFVDLTFNFQRRLGLQQNRLLVYLKGQKKPMTLVLEVEFPKPYTYSQKFLTWKGTDRQKKHLTLNFHKDFNASASLQEGKNEIPLEINLLKVDDQQYKISATPKKDIKKGRYRTDIVITQENKPSRISTVYFILN